MKGNPEVLTNVRQFMPPLKRVCGVSPSCLFSLTDISALAGCFVSDLQETKALPGMRKIKGVDFELIPTSGVSKSELDGDSEKRVGSGKLYDCFIPSKSDNCPHPLIRNRPDGHITGDLFEEVSPDLYAFREC